MAIPDIQMWITMQLRLNVSVKGKGFVKGSDYASVSWFL